jgi:asparagine synthase (glutamine-hydrolysing)
VLHVKDDLWIVSDRVSGDGAHEARLHWLGGEFPWAYEPAAGRMSLETRAGEFTVTVLGDDGRPRAGDVVAGRDAPPRGWLSRYYGEKTAVPSLAVTQKGICPREFVSVLAGGRPSVSAANGAWHVATGHCSASFRIRDGLFEDVSVVH